MSSDFGTTTQLTIQRGGINSALKAINYTLNLMLLAVIKYFQNTSHPDFKVSTEIQESQPFDDVIVELDNTETRFVQCKFKENPIILSFDDFINRHKKSFYLTKYFEGYIKIKERFQNTRDLVICTNMCLANLSYSIPNSHILLDRTSNGKITFQRVTRSDNLFGSFSERFKIDANCSETKTTIKSMLIADISRPHPNVTQMVDKYLEGFLNDLLFVFDVKRQDIEREIENFMKSFFNMSVVDHSKLALMSILNNWVENMRTVRTINKKIFEEFLEYLKQEIGTIPNVIERSSTLFRSSNFKFKIPNEVINFIQKIKNGSNRLFYMQMMEGDSFYGCCMINQELQFKNSDDLLFLSTNIPSDIEEGLKNFTKENRFDFFIFEESEENFLHDRYKSQIKKVLNINQKKRALIITDQLKSKFAADIIENDENLLTIPEIRLSDLTQQSLALILDKKLLKFQNEIVKFNRIMDSSDQNLIYEIRLKDLVSISTIGHNVVLGKNFDPDLYISRKLLQRNVIKSEIMSSTKNTKDTEKMALSEESFKTYCNQFPDANVHWLEKQTNGSDLVWKKSQGQIDFLYDYLNLKQGTMIEDPWDTQISVGGMVFLLSDVPGMGKTSWLNQLAQTLKTKNKDHFIVNISLINHIQYFRDHTFDNEDSVIEFLESQELKPQTDMEKKLFTKACTTTKKVIVILDELVEMCREYEQKVFKMIEIINEMGIAGLYISTRPEFKRVIEKNLKNFCHQFIPFSEEDLLKFLTNFWRRKIQGNLSSDELREVAEKAILLMRKNKLTEITKMPLITKMVAEIFDPNVILQDDSIMEKTFRNVSGLYKGFMDKNIDFFLSERVGIDLSHEIGKKIVEREKQDVINLYKNLAAKIVLPQHLELFNENFELTSNELKRISYYGLVISGPKIEFIDITIAEYFAHLKILEKFNNESIAKFIVRELLCEENFTMVRSFLNSSIKDADGDFELYGKILVEFKDDFKKSTKIACDENNDKILDFLVKSFFVFQPEVSV